MQYIKFRSTDATTYMECLSQDMMRRKSGRLDKRRYSTSSIVKNLLITNIIEAIDLALPFTITSTLLPTFIFNSTLK